MIRLKQAHRTFTQPQIPKPCVQASFRTQANALFHKNAAYQRRNRRANCCITVRTGPASSRDGLWAHT